MKIASSNHLEPCHISDGRGQNKELNIPRASSSMSRPLESLSLCSPHKAKLARAGYETVDDMKYVRVAELSRGR